MKKTQVSVDFVVVFSILLLVFLSVLVIMNKRDNEFLASKTKFYAKSVCDRVATEINMVCLAGDGAKKTVKLSRTLKDNNYYLLRVHPTSHIIEVLWVYNNELMHHSCPIVCGVTGNISVGGDFNVSNEVNGTQAVNYNVCEGYCADYGNNYGICRNDVNDCYVNGENPSQDNIYPFCSLEGASVCCCG